VRVVTAAFSQFSSESAINMRHHHHHHHQQQHFIAVIFARLGACGGDVPLGPVTQRLRNKPRELLNWVRHWLHLGHRIMIPVEQNCGEV